MANQVKDVSRRIGQLTGELGAELATISETMVTKLERQQGRRLTDLALNMIDVIDRNLYERSCDVRWWATDAAIVDAATGAAQAAAHASSRMSVILDSCTVYLDIWILDLEGHVIANGRPAAFPVVGVANAKDQPWFEAALHTRSGDEYVTANVDKVRELGGAHAAAYATAIREGAARNGRIVGSFQSSSTGRSRHRRWLTTYG